eukprot:CAMPEP_0184489600 /NCGR_PEP_ID=MMETSP0113_2-20130426/15917_1 /TAXON_ID=91329 /ORGANISM="Norrisiella sphaerica, Strain BC52" /LENGTH=243 /DNA_ID=CAMNT_0026873123 /DNA_START=133 /DNA_END=864 /DNA_ORIENTATION=+
MSQQYHHRASSELGADDEDEGNKMYLYALVAVNFVLTCCAIALLGLGIYGLGQAEKLRSLELLVDMPVDVVAVIITILGAISTFACACGFYGAYTKRRGLGRKLLYFYLFVVFTAMLVQLCMCIFLYTYGTEAVLNDLVTDRWFEEGDIARERRIDYQDFFECCGWENPYDSRASGYNTPCPRPGADSCLNATMEYFDENFLPMALFGMILAILEFVAVMATVVILCVRKKIYDENEFDVFDF